MFRIQRKFIFSGFKENLSLPLLLAKGSSSLRPVWSFRIGIFRKVQTLDRANVLFGFTVGVSLSIEKVKRKSK